MNFTPRYAIGDKVWHAHTTMTTKVFKCPDCLGTGTWEAHTPAGDVLKMQCARCGEAHRTWQIPTLRYQEWAATARLLTIGSIQIDTANTNDPVRYMCVETGVGTGSVYYERQLAATEEEAAAMGVVLVAEMNADQPQIAERTKSAMAYSMFTFPLAAAEAHREIERTVVLRGQDLGDELRLLADEVSLKDDDLCTRLHVLRLKAENLRLDRQRMEALIAEERVTANAR